MRMDKLTINGFSCDVCGSSISKPNRFLHEMLIQLKNLNEIKEYNFEYSPKWAKPYRYDGFILLNNNKKILIEVQGSHHYGIGKFGQDKEKIEERDKKKLLKAKEKGIKLIYIEAKDSNFIYLKNNFINSELKQFINFNKIDWNKLYYNTQIGEIQEICKKYNEENFSSIKDLSNKIGVERNILTKKLKIGTILGLCNYDSKKQLSLSKVKKIKIIDKNKKIYIANSLKEASLIAEVTVHTIRNCITGKIKNNRKGYKFEYLNESTLQ